MFPWLAMGHLIPFFNLSKLFAKKGHSIYFISTPRNLLRLPKLPPNISSLITLIPLPLPHVQSLPHDVECTVDINYHQQQSLKLRFDLLQSSLTTYLHESTPDWIIYDYASHWLPKVAAELGISRAYFSLFNAASLAFLGPPSVLLNEDSRTTAKDFTFVPKWIPFESNVVFRLHEVSKYTERISDKEGVPLTSDLVRFGVAIQESEVVLIRSCFEFEPDYLSFLGDLYDRKPVLPVGFLPPSLVEDEETKENNDDDKNWVGIKKWLDTRRVGSVVYVALGTEVTLTREELSEMALGLKKSGLPFFWVLRKQTDELPDGFEVKIQEQGRVHTGWAPQVKILSHEAVGGFLTHCGWNSVVEGLGFGRVLVLFPALNEQGLNARLLHGKKLGLEIPRNERDGWFTSDSVAESLRLAMVDDSGELLRNKAKGMKGLIGDRDRNAHYVDEVARYLEENGPRG
ncbi:UDPGT domain-containing protein [Cephalotus follicularis]|uniref:UDPGT domain-containing protein n=1 Tax=Cephalotus follicularis TaxID=3775 RepID=A0A1Q3BG65_CEPFO|nr:UDPGT domain-containing protein [Cephalotus follicularis]